MGVEYSQIIWPEPGTFKPTVQELANLIETLVRNTWLPDPTSGNYEPVSDQFLRDTDMAKETGAYVTTSEGKTPFRYPVDILQLTELYKDEFIICWPIDISETKSLHYPFATDISDTELFYEFKVQVLNDYYFNDELPVTKCVCGTELRYESESNFFWGDRIHTTCPQCGTPFNIADYQIEIENEETCFNGFISGGCNYLFGIEIDCAKCVPFPSSIIIGDYDYNGPIKIRNSLKKLLEESLNVTIREIGSYH